ncbi:FAD binding domain-containing protein [Brevibacterium sp. BDJS002]|uniref:FAD binding domain-containing protein n=1 Tax=Brevibacterium sp. BDJS002 TaxID=3020906 RepID=UPI00230832BD|nr:FAD binding domain-containing protein [Brevibacterium sp. BDJS002]WCE41204.1 FAD binding domain-containing protein [Brevibacterium sp. BDJS002]
MIVSQRGDHGSEVDFYRPEDLHALFDTLQNSPRDTLLLGGGMTAMPYLNRNEWSTSCIISLSRVAELRGIQVSATTLRIGASTTHTQLAESAEVSAHCPVLAVAAGSIGDLQVRNRGTIGGVVAFANSGADYLTVLTALDAVVILRSAHGSRRMPVRDFLTDSRSTALAAGEVVEAVEVACDPSRRARYLRLTRIQGAPPVLTVAAVAGRQQQTLSIGGATPTPTLLGRKVFDAEAHEVRDLVLSAVADPAGEAHAPRRYRRHMAAEYSVRVLKELADSLEEAHS